MMFDLDDMSRTDLAHLARCIEALEEASDGLERAFGAQPRFVLAPGRAAKVILPPLFVGAPAEISVVEGRATADAMRAQRMDDIARGFFAARSMFARDDANSCPEPAPAPQEAEGFDPAPFVATAATAEAELAAAEGFDLPRTPPEPTPPEEQPKPGRADAWSNLELSQVFEAGVEALMAGRALTSAAQPLADALGRTVAACQKQLKLARERIEERAAELTPRPADPEPAADPAPPPAAARVQHNLPTDDLQSHLNAHVATGGWTAADDLRLFDLSETGWPVHEVALEIEKSSDEVKRRFDLLTDEKGCKFPRADVLDRLRLMQPVDA